MEKQQHAETSGEHNQEQRGRRRDAGRGAQRLRRQSQCRLTSSASKPAAISVTPCPSRRTRRGGVAPRHGKRMSTQTAGWHHTPEWSLPRPSESPLWRRKPHGLQTSWPRGLSIRPETTGAGWRARGRRIEWLVRVLTYTDQSMVERRGVTARVRTRGAPALTRPEAQRTGSINWGTFLRIVCASSGVLGWEHHPRATEVFSARHKMADKLP